MAIGINQWPTDAENVFAFVSFSFSRTIAIFLFMRYYKRGKNKDAQDNEERGV